MTQNISVQYFPPKEGSRDNDLGGGYVTSGILKTRFSVIKTDKNEHGFFVSLPRVKDANGEWKDIVSTVNKEGSDLLIRLVKDKMNPGTEQQAPATRPATPQTPSNATRRVPPKTPGTGTPGSAPW